MIIVSDNPIASAYNIIVDQGETFTRVFTWQDDDTDEPIDVSGATAAMKVRKLYPATFLTPAHADAAIISLTDAAGITLGGAEGTIAPQIESSVIQACTPDIYNYQLFVTISSITYVIAEGTFTIRQGVM